MDKDQIVLILKILKTSYPRFYLDMSKEEAENTIALWTEMFAHEDPMLVTASVKNLINTFKWPPTIADIKENMYKLTNQNNESSIDLWNDIKKAIRNSAYNSFEEFEKLPELAKKFVGSPNQLKEWALAIDYNDSVVKGQFLKQVEILKNREKEETMMLPETKELVKKISDKLSTKLLN